MDYDAPATYARLIAPPYGRIADALVEAAALRAEDDGLELGAGTGVVTKRAAPRVRSLVATDVSRSMLAVARKSMRRTAGVSFALLDYNDSFPFLDTSFDVVVSGLTYVQNSAPALSEIARVLKANGRLALAMWGNSYHEHRVLSDALESISGERLPSPAPGQAVRRLERVGFRSVTRSDVEMTNRFESVDEYLAYRRGFGSPGGWTRAKYDRFLRAVHREASSYTDSDGRFTLGWTVSIITARRPR
jgi:ubiquinone/menaquinone biosynthesis C-methylase UbiE